jgi:hypothetical protein
VYLAAGFQGVQACGSAIMLVHAVVTVLYVVAGLSAGRYLQGV